jgi:hypothetical protein
MIVISEELYDRIVRRMEHIDESICFDLEQEVEEQKMEQLRRDLENKYGR